VDAVRIIIVGAVQGVHPVLRKDFHFEAGTFKSPLLAGKHGSIYDTGNVLLVHFLYVLVGE